MICIYVVLCLMNVTIAQYARNCYQIDEYCRLRLDNYYETSDPMKQKEVNLVIRGLKLAPSVVILQTATFISAMIESDQQTDLWAGIALALSVINVAVNVGQSVICSDGVWGLVHSAIQLWLPQYAATHNPITYRSRRETMASFTPEKFREMEKKRKEERRAMAVEDAWKAWKARRDWRIQFPDCPKTMLPALCWKGPKRMVHYTYDLTNKEYIPSRVKELKMTMWTKKYLEVRPIYSVSVERAIEYVKDQKEVDEFLDGSECSVEDAQAMFAHWTRMMTYQDKIDYASRTKKERKWYWNSEKRAYIDDNEDSLLLANRIWLAPVDPTKKRLLDPVIQFFEYQDLHPLAIEIVDVGDYMTLEKKTFVRSVPCITRNEEERKGAEIEQKFKESIAIWDRVYDDDAFIVALLPDVDSSLPLAQQNEAIERNAKMRRMLDHRHNIVPIPRGVKSPNPRTDLMANMETWDNHNRPGFIGPQLPEDSLPLGPLLHRYRLFIFTEESIEDYWRLLEARREEQRANVLARREIARM